MIIYKAFNTINNKCYIGQTIQTLKRRIGGHKYASKAYKGNQYFHKAIRKHKLNNFTWKILCKCDNQNELDEMEHHYIKQYHSHVSEYGYNLTWGYGNTTTGYKFTKKQRDDASKRVSGKNNPMYGIKITGKDNHFYNKHHTLETKKKISKSNKNKPHPKGILSPSSKKWFIYGQLFYSLNDASKKFDVGSSTIRSWCSKKFPLCYKI